MIEQHWPMNDRNGYRIQLFNPPHTRFMVVTKDTDRRFRPLRFGQQQIGRPEFAILIRCKREKTLLKRETLLREEVGGKRLMKQANRIGKVGIMRGYMCFADRRSG